MINKIRRDQFLKLVGYTRNHIHEPSIPYKYTHTQTERERHTHRQRERDTHTQTERETHTHTDIHTHIYRQTHTHTHVPTHIKYRYNNRHNFH